MKVFPAWAEFLGLKDAVITGIDMPLHAEAGATEVVEFIRDDPLSLGALVTRTRSTCSTRAATCSTRSIGSPN